MNNLDKQYTDLLQDILDNGVTKQDRTGTGTLSVFGRQIRHKMSDGFPLLTTKKMPFRLIATELLWFLRGDTNIKFLVDNNCHIWDGDAYKNYLKWAGNNPLTIEEFIEKIKTDSDFAGVYGELGPIYGKQWRSWSGVNYLNRVSNNMSTPIIDQIANLIRDLKTNPDSRRLMVNSWNVGQLSEMTLPPCHYGFQVYTRELSKNERLQYVRNQVTPITTDGELHNIAENIPTRAISLMWNQRSVDTFLGLPFNIASYGLLLEIIAKEVNMVPDELIGNLGDTHLYLNHIEQAKEQIGRELTLEERYDLIPAITGHTKENIELRKKINNFEGNNGESYHEEWINSFNIPQHTREPYPLPKLIICGDMRREDGFTVPFDELDHSLIKLIDYQSHPTIKAPLSN